MNITTANYFESVKNLDWKTVPPSLKKTHETLVPDASKDNWSAYHSDLDIRRVIDKYFIYVGKYIINQKRVANTLQSKSRKDKTTEPETSLPQPKLVTYIPTATSFIKRYAALHGKVKTRDQIVSLIHGLQRAITEQRIRKSEPTIREIEKMQQELIALATSMGENVKIELDEKSLEHYRQIARGEEVRTTVKLLKSFITMNGRTIDKLKVAKLLLRMEKALETVPGEDPYLPEIKNALKALKSYDSNNAISIPAAALHGLGAVALRGANELGFVVTKSEPPVIRLLRAANVKDLSDKTLKKVFSKTIAPTYFFELAKAYIRAGKLSMEILSRLPTGNGFSGLHGTELDISTSESGLNEVDLWNGRLTSNSAEPTQEKSPANIDKTTPVSALTPAMPEQRSVSAKELAIMKFKTIGYNGRFKKVVGDPAIGFRMMVYGKPYNGKSSFVIELCKDLAALRKGSIAYLALEEGISLSMQKKVIERGADKVDGLEFKGTMPASFADYGFVVIDSVSDRSISREHLRRLFLQNPKTCFICIFHATKTGTARGGLDYSHDMDIIIKIEDHLPVVEKNRFL